MSDHTALASFELTCSSAPVQAEGTIRDGRAYYFRARHSTIRLSVGDTIDDAVEGVGPTVYLTIDSSGEHPASWMPPELAEPLAEWMATVALAEEADS